jgi:hypothetical protein
MTMATHTSLAPLYAYAPIGERAFFEVPRNRGSNTTLLCSLRSEGVGPSMVMEGATAKEVFEASYAEQHFLTPTLRSGEIVVMDNLRAHRPKRIRELIETAEPVEKLLRAILWFPYRGLKIHFCSL